MHRETPRTRQALFLFVIATFAALPMLTLPSVEAATLFYYEANIAPTAAGWTLSQSFCEPGESSLEGWLVHTVTGCAGFQPPDGQQIDYRRSLDDFAATASFFVEWRMVTSGPRSEMAWGGPAKLVLGSFGPTNYRFTISDDLAELNRDNLLPIVQIPLASAIPHSFRLELLNPTAYAWYVDNQVVDSGIPEGPYPVGDQPAILFRAKSSYFPNTTQWDYIRYGTIPADGSGDFDSNGAVDTSDVYFFLDCLLGPDSAGPGCRWADVNHDGATNAADIQPFVAAMMK